MKAFFSILKWKDIKEKLSEVIESFPLPFIISLGITLLFFVLTGAGLGSEMQGIIGKYIMTGVICFFLSTGLTLFADSFKKYSPPLTHFFLGVITLGFGVLFYLFLSSDFDSIETLIFFLLNLFGVVSLLFIAPYIKYLRGISHAAESYYVYFYRISLVLLASLVIGGILTLLGNIAIAAVRTLFEIQYQFMVELHAYWTSFALAFLAPIFGLSQLPKKENFEEKYFNESVFFNFLISYIAIPFIYIYFFILYAYSAKVLINFSDWPKGEVSWMVIGFSLFGYITYMFSYLFECGSKKQHHKLIVIFRKFFSLAVLPQIAMLFYAISLRIGQYDLTINRYFVCVFGIWLLVISLYLIISQKKALLYIPSLFTLFICIISIGPWSVYHLPLTRQVERLEENLIEANILQGSSIVPLQVHADISPELSHQIHDGIEYICGFNSCKDIIEIFPDLYNDLYEKNQVEHENLKKKYPHESWREDEYSGPSRWEITNYISEKIKVQKTYSWELKQTPSYRMYSSDSLYPLDVAGYKSLLSVNSSSYDDVSGSMGKAGIIDIQSETLSLTTEEGINIIDISSVFETIRTNLSPNIDNKASKSDTRFEILSQDISGTLIIESAHIPQEIGKTNDIYHHYYMSGFFLMK